MLRRTRNKVNIYIYIYRYHKGGRDTALEAEAQLYSKVIDLKIMQVKECK